MYKKGLIAVAVLLVFGVSYLIAQSSDNNSTPTQSNPPSDNAGQSTKETSGDSLDLSGKQLTTLSDSVLQSSSLKNLNVSNNQLTSLPADISKLTNLEILNIENNRLESFPTEISQLKNLREIRANNNRMTSVPDELGTMTWLRTLDISGNKIPAEQIEQLKSKLTDTDIKT